MKPLTWYLGVGVVVLVLMMVSHRFFGKDYPDSLSAVLEKERPFWFMLLEESILVLLIVLLSPFWPILVVKKLIDTFHKKPDQTPEDEREFAVELVHLKEQISIEEIEQREIVFDPLGAVSDLPFGHLHSAWQKLLSQMEENETIWTFETIWTPWYGSKELMIGYAVKKGDGVGPHLITLCKRLD